jgi:hypothetical protein
MGVLYDHSAIGRSGFSTPIIGAVHFHVDTYQFRDFSPTRKGDIKTDDCASEVVVAFGKFSLTPGTLHVITYT